MFAHAQCVDDRIEARAHVRERDEARDELERVGCLGDADLRREGRKRESERERERERVKIES